VSSGAVRPPPSPALGECFDDVVLPHLEAAHRLARWLLRNDHDAEDVVQEAALRAFRYFRTFTGGNGRAWFLRIVRNTCHGWRSHRAHVPMDPFDEEWHSSAHPGADPEMLLLRSDSSAAIDRAMNHLPDRFRELLTLRELEGLSYQEIADVKGIPIGTVMSGLSRAREAFRSAVIDRPAGPDARIEDARKAGVSRGERNRPKMLALRHRKRDMRARRFAVRRPRSASPLRAPSLDLVRNLAD
jgi:RNA polymerase sigma-70 factor (ECF subfamily)